MFFFNKQQHPLSENALFQLKDFRTGQNQNIIKILFEILKKKSPPFFLSYGRIQITHPALENKERSTCQKPAEGKLLLT